jgi:hypothetical protein
VVVGAQHAARFDAASIETPIQLDARRVLDRTESDQLVRVRRHMFVDDSCRVPAAEKAGNAGLSLEVGEARKDKR